MISFVFKSICFLFLTMCSFQFNPQSKCSPRYFATSVWGMIVWLMLTAGQWPFCHNFRIQLLNTKWAIIRLQKYFRYHWQPGTIIFKSPWCIYNIFLESGKLLVLWIFQNFKFFSFHVIDLFWLKYILIECNFCWVWPKTCLYVFEF